MAHIKKFDEFNNEETDLSDVYGEQRIYKAPLLEVKDIGNLFHRHNKDGYIIISGCIEISRRHKADIAEFAGMIDTTLDDLHTDRETEETDYFKRFLLTLNNLEKEGYDHSTITDLKKKAKRLLNKNNSENKRATEKLKERLKGDGYTFSVSAGGYVENGVNVLEHSFVVYVDKIDIVHRGKVDSKKHMYKCAFGELVEYGKRLCRKEEFDQECFSVKYPNDGKAVWMDERGEIVMEFNKVLVDDIEQKYFTTTAMSKRMKELGFFTPARPQRFSFVESFCQYRFPCCREYKYITDIDGIVCW